MPKKQAADKWLSIAVPSIREKITKLKVGETGALLNSVGGNVKATDAEVTAVLQYLFYGIFPDMGVGRGITMADADTAKLLGFKRKRKNWTREIANQRHIFSDIMTNEFADDAIKEVLKLVPKTIVMKT